MFAHQLADFYDDGQPCRIEGEEADCWLGAYMIFAKALMFTMMHSWQSLGRA